MLAITKKKGSNEIVLAQVKSGDLLGEMTFFDKTPRSASAMAAAHDTEVIELPFSALEAQWSTLPSWVKSITKAINSNLRRANIRIRQLERTQAEETEQFPSHTINQLMSILGFVAFRYGEDTEHGFQIPAGKLRNYTIQVFQQSTHKMNVLTEALEKFGYMKIESLEEGRVRLIINDLDFIFRFVEFYNKQLFSDDAKKLEVTRQSWPTLKVAQHYGEKETPNDKGFVKLNLTEARKAAITDLSLRVNMEDVKHFSEVGILGEFYSENGHDHIEFEIDYVSEAVPYWELVHHLKSLTRD